MIDNLPERVGAVEKKLDALARSVDRRFVEVNERFDQFDKRFDEVDRRFEQIDKRFEQVDQRFDEVDKRFKEVDERFKDVTRALVEQREYTEFAFDRLRREMMARFDRVATRTQVDRIERKLDRFAESVSDAMRVLTAPRRSRKR
jgi:chromosome segregation ATPase